MTLKKTESPVAKQEPSHAVYITSRRGDPDINNFKEKSTRFDKDSQGDRIAAHDLFSLFTATIIQQKVPFIR